MNTKEESSQPHRDSFLGRMIADRYLVKRLIARGGMGAVYEAEQRPLGRKVALKVLQEPPNSGDSEAFQRRFFLEAATLAKLDHPHTVTLFDYGQTNDHIFYLVMEYIDGPPLSRLLKRHGGTLPPQRTLLLMSQIASALHNAHKQDVVHRDLKPGNLLICTNSEGVDTVKVVDFGLVKLTEGDQAITVTGMIMGSPHCMAPEQVQGGDVDHRADIYAIGVLLHRCLCGRYPFHGSTTTATMIAHIQQEIPSLADAAPNLELPEGLEAIIRRCLDKDPEQRFPDMGELGQALRACLDVPPEEFTAVSTIVEVPEPEPRSKLPWALGLVALLALGGVAWWASQPPPEPEQPVLALVAVQIKSAPAGASVRVGEDVLGTTPLLIDLAPGRTTFELDLAGYEHTSAVKELQIGQPLSLNLQLQAIPTWTQEELAEPLTTERPEIRTKPPGTKPPGTKPVDTKPDSKPADTKPADTKPADTKPADTKPADTKPADTKPADSTASSETPVDKPPAGYKSNPFD